MITLIFSNKNVKCFNVEFKACPIIAFKNNNGHLFAYGSYAHFEKSKITHDKIFDITINGDPLNT